MEQFTYFASHDLKEPMREVNVFAQLLEREGFESMNEKQRSYLQHVASGAKRINQMISDLTEYMRSLGDEEGGGAKNQDECDCREIVEQVLGNLKMSIDEAKATIHLGSLPKLNVSLIQMTRVIQNLVGNSLKFKGTEPLQIHISAEAQSDDWLFSVKDNGIGFEQKFSEYIFIIFKRLPGVEKTSGSGVGLAICSQIIRRLGGRIWAESEPGKGASFFFTIPKVLDKTHEVN